MFPHPLASGVMAPITFREKDRVEAVEELSQVPVGTPGVVVSVTGLDWIRYRVQFDNGIERNLVDAKRLRAVPKEGRRRPLRSGHAGRK